MLHWKHLTSNTGPDSKRNVHEMPIDMLQFKAETVILGVIIDLNQRHTLACPFTKLTHIQPNLTQKRKTQFTRFVYIL